MTKKLLLINDFSGYGKVALSAMSPVLTRQRYEVFALPTLIVSNTLDYGKFASIDTTEYMKESFGVWKELGFKFDALSTGFIANDAQADFVMKIAKELSDNGAVIFTDPVMADNGKLYNSITENRVEIMKKLVAVADYIFPNMTEACFLSDTEYCKEGFTKEEIYEIAKKLHELGAKSVIITSALVKDNKGIGRRAVIGYDNKKGSYFTIYYKEIPLKINGSGDTFFAYVMKDIIKGYDLKRSVKKAVNKISFLIRKNIDIAEEYNGLP